MIEDLIFIINVVLPVFLLVIIGVILKVLKLIDDSFLKTALDFVYRVSLPALVFMKLYNVNLNYTYDSKLVVLIIGGILFTFFVAFITAKNLKLEPQNEGVFVQGAYRSNIAIVGLAIVLRMFGTDALAKASLLLLFSMPLFNLLAVIALTLPFSNSRTLDFRATVKEIIRNPLLVAVTIAMIFSFFKIPVHKIIAITTNYIADTALPLALVGIGGYLNINSVKEASALAFFAAAIKNIFSPVVITLAAIYWDIRGVDLGIIFILFASPTAVASFVMASGMKGNIKLAGNIIIISTLGSIFTIIAGLFFLRLFDWI